MPGAPVASQELAAAAEQDPLAKAYLSGLTVTPSAVLCGDATIDVEALDPDPMVYVGMYGYLVATDVNRTDRLVFHRYSGTEQLGAFLTIEFVTPRSTSGSLGYVFELDGPRAKGLDGAALEWVTTSDDTLLACCSLRAAPYYGMHHSLSFDWEAAGGAWAWFHWMNVIAV